MSMQGPEFVGLAAKYLSTNLNRLESAVGCFVCLSCPSNTKNGDLHSQSTWNPVIFSNHLSSFHSNVDMFTCVFCGIEVPAGNFIVHMASHFTNSPDVCTNSVYSCPVPDCVPVFQTNSLQCLQVHFSAHHKSNRTAAKFLCLHCRETVTSLQEWIEHIDTNSMRLSHCTVDGCFVKSPSKSLVIEHIRRVHGRSVGFCESDCLGFIKETVESACSCKGSIPSLLRSYIQHTPSIQPPVQRLPSPTLSVANTPSQTMVPSVVLCLRCPGCGFATTRWNQFLQHSSAGKCCPVSLETNSPGLYACNLFWCSQCSTVSTERDLLQEHIQSLHDSSSAVIILEKFEIATSNLDAASDLVKLKPLLKSPQPSLVPNFPASNSSLATNSANNFSKLADVLSVFSKLLPPSVASSTSQSLNPIYSTPITAVKSAKSNGTSCLPSTSSACQSFKLANGTSPSTPTATSVVSSNSVGGDILNTPNSPPFASRDVSSVGSLFTPSCSLANPFMNSSFPDPNGLFSPEAASAVAAMAAAALSGLTGLGVNALASSGDIGETGSQSSNASRVDSEGVVSESHVGSTTPTASSVSMNGVAEYAKDASTSVGEDGLSMIRAGSSNNGEELVSFPFDEVVFRNEMSSRLSSDLVELLIEKMQRFSGYLVRIVGKENHRRIPVCPECNKVFSYGLGDFKRHLLSIHLEVPRDLLKDCLRYTRLPKGEEKFQEVQEQLAMRQMKPHLIEPGRRRIPLPYSIKILRRLTEHLLPSIREFLFQKMRLYSRLAVIMENKAGVKKYKCFHCAYASPHALADVRKHILGSHCGISTKYFRYCLQASRLDPVEFCLLSDERLARLARDFLSKRQTSGGSEAGDQSTAASEDQPPSPPAVDIIPAAKIRASKSSSHCRPEKSPPSTVDENGVSRFTTLIPGSKNPVTVCIRPPVPPSVPGLSPNAAGPVSPEANKFTSLKLDSMPKVPGIEGADQIINLPLPFSEPVLRQLLEAAGAQPEQVEDITRKMHVYSTYVMTRICNNERTLAFRCPCGRIFVTTRQPESKMRAATLADSRRHVMGVHARIPHEYITICCQASRISRENNFQLYPDDMLIRLAMDRPIRLNNSTNNTTGISKVSSSTSMATITSNRSSNCRPSSSVVLPPLRPLTDMVADSSDNPEENNGCGGEVCESPNSADTGDFVFQDEGASFDEANQGSSRPSPRHDINHAARRPFRSPFRSSLSRMSNLKMRSSASPRLKKTRRESSMNSMEMVFACGGDETHTNDVIPSSDETLRFLNEKPSNDVERVIDLPYSKSALRVLVRGYCPPSFFSMLVAKMELYTAYKVFVTRIRGRRFFCCSGCTSTSPHGMGDIRKHILGVHAKVPERYKAAAMHCSRLSREDNSLLPDRSLLQLAKMKWKGTVIKPLAEINIGNFGHRRASALGLSSPNSKSSPGAHSDVGASQNGSFESSPVIFSSHLSDGTPEFACSACDVCATDSGSVRAHYVRVHMAVLAYHCPFCLIQSEFAALADIQQHIAVEHSDEEVSPIADLISEAFQTAIHDVVIQETGQPMDRVQPPLSVSNEELELGALCSFSDSSKNPIPRESSSAQTKTVLYNGALFPDSCSLLGENDAETSISTAIGSSSTASNTGLYGSVKSGSSRRKPLKSHLIQFKPEDDEDEATVASLAPNAFKRRRTSGPDSLGGEGEDQDSLLLSDPTSSSSHINKLTFAKEKDARPVNGAIPCD